MRSFRDQNPYVVGIVSVLVIGTATALAFMVGFLNFFEKAYEMEGTFVDASGLRTGDDVRVAGIKVGRVTGIEVNRDLGTVDVEWVVNDGVEIHDGAGAEIALSSLLGARHVRILNPMVGDAVFEDLPREQRVIGLEDTKVPFDVFRLTRIATEGIQELDTEKLNTLLVDLADITENKAATVEDLVVGIQRVGAAINERDQQFAALLDQAERLSTTLADKDDEILALLDASGEILSMVVERRNDLALVLGETAQVVQQLDRIITTHEQDLDRILDVLHPTLALVEEHQADLDKALAWLGPGLLQQAQGGAQGPWQDIFVRSVQPDVLEVLQDLYGLLLGVE